MKLRRAFGFAVYSSHPICTTVSSLNTGLSPNKYSSKIFVTKSKHSSYCFVKSRWSFSLPDVPVRNSGNTLVNANECAGVSNSGTIFTPITLDSSIKSLNSAFV